MNLDIISIGDELLIGQTLNTNAYWISQQMNAIGFTIRQHISIADTKDAILLAVDNSLKNSDVVLVTGGLGPTKDDLTMPVLNSYFGGNLVRNQKVYNHIEKIITSKGYEMNQNNKDQALVPDICKVIFNDNGTAPCLWFDKGNKVLVAMPGVPFETKALITDKIIPLLKLKYEMPEIINHMVYTQGIPESMLAEVISDWEANLPQTISLAYLPSVGRVKLRLSSTGFDRVAMQLLIDDQVRLLKKLIPDNIYSELNEGFANFIGEQLKLKNQTLATAESCTGGYVSHLITRVSGSSEYYKGSVIAYANEIKIEELGVSLTDIEQYGAVSKQVVEQMAVGVQQKMKTDYAIATSGIAGPTGGSDEKPVGTVWIAIATPHGVVSKVHQFGKLREVNIERAAITSLSMLNDTF